MSSSTLDSESIHKHKPSRKESSGMSSYTLHSESIHKQTSKKASLVEYHRAYCLLGDKKQMTFLHHA